MTTKQLTILVAFLVLAVGIGFRLGAQQEPASGNGRYAIVQGEYVFTTSASKATLSERDVFRIDTVTGQAWRFVFDDANTYWAPIQVAQLKTRQ